MTKINTREKTDDKRNVKEEAEVLVIFEELAS